MQFQMKSSRAAPSDMHCSSPAGMQFGRGLLCHQLRPLQEKAQLGCQPKLRATATPGLPRANPPQFSCWSATPLSLRGSAAVGWPDSRHQAQNLHRRAGFKPNGLITLRGAPQLRCDPHAANLLWSCRVFTLKGAEIHTLHENSHPLWKRASGWLSGLP